MTTPELRPMGIGDILDATFRLYRQRFLTFLLVGLVVYMPYALLAALFQASLGLAEEPSTMAAGAGLRQVPTNPAGLWLLIIGTLVFLIVLFPLCTAAMVHNISASYLGESLTAGQSYSRAAPRLLSLLGTQILAGLVHLRGTFCF